MAPEFSGSVVSCFDEDSKTDSAVENKYQGERRNQKKETDTSHLRK